MNHVVIAIADQVLNQQLRTRLEESDFDVTVDGVAESPNELAAIVLKHRPQVLFVHDHFGGRPGAVLPVVRDLISRDPGLSVLVVSSARGAEVYSNAMDMGAVGVLLDPFGLEELNQRLGSAIERSQVIRAAAGDGGGRNRVDDPGRVISIAGAKGGVGTTIFATHLAWDIATSEPGMRVCLMDLDIEKGDVPSYLDVNHRVSIADLAKISDDLAPRSVSDTVIVHTSGLHLLLAPTEIREAEFVTPDAVRRIIARLRTMYHLVIVDTGSAVTTSQAAAVESSDLTVQLVRAEVPALRAARRQMVAWESLGVAEPEDVRVVVNRFDKRGEIQQDTIDRLVLGERSQILLPVLDQALSRAGNTRTPSEVRNQRWWKSVRAIGDELDVAQKFRESLAESAGTATSVRNAASVSGGSVAAEGRRGGAVTGAASGSKVARGRRSADAGQIALETAAMFPLALAVLVLCMQFLLLGLSFVWCGVASDAAARAVSLGEDPTAAVAAAVPSGMSTSVSFTPDGQVEVGVDSPLLVGSGVTQSVEIDTRRSVVEEP